MDTAAILLVIADLEAAAAENHEGYMRVGYEQALTDLRDTLSEWEDDSG
jgi:hypothetical protein